MPAWSPCLAELVFVFLFLLYLGYLICMVCDIQMYIENDMNLKELSSYGLVIAGLTTALNFLLSQDLIAVSDNRILLYFKREMDLTNIRIAKVKSVLGRKWIYIEGENCKRILITDINSCKRILAMFEQRKDKYL